MPLTSLSTQQKSLKYTDFSAKEADLLEQEKLYLKPEKLSEIQRTYLVGTINVKHL